MAEGGKFSNQHRQSRSDTPSLQNNNDKLKIRLMWSQLNTKEG